MKYLVTNPYGIGGHLVLRFIEQGESVFTIYPTPKEVPMSFLGKINLKYGFLKFDRDTDFTKTLPKRVEYVIHSYDMYSGPFTSMFRANPWATLSLLDWARKIPVKQFIYVSSGEIYGQGSNIDEHAPYNPNTFYATTKFETEYLFRFYQTSFPITTVRVFFPFGRNTPSGMIAQLAEAIKKQRPFQTNYSTISPTYVNDVVDVINNIVSNGTSNVYNVCGSPVDISTIAEKLAQIINIPLVKLTLGKTVLTGSNAKARTQLAFKETPLDKALEQAFQIK